MMSFAGNRSGSVALPPSPFDAARNTASPMMSQPGYSGSMGSMGPGSYGAVSNSMMSSFGMSQPLQQQVSTPPPTPPPPPPPSTPHACLICSELHRAGVDQSH